MFIKIENRHGNGVTTEVIECDRYETKTTKDGLTIEMYRGDETVERSVARQNSGEGVSKKHQKKTGEFGKLLTVYIMNNQGATIDKIIM